MIFTKKASILFIFTICIFFTLNLKAQIVNDTIIPIPVDTTSELVLDTTQFEDAYIPEDIQFIPSDILYHNNWNNKDVKIRSEKYFNANNRYTLPLVKESESVFVLPCSGKVISPFGFRGRRVHSGTDIKLSLNDEVFSAFDGVVRMAKRYSGYGNVVVIRHYNGLETLYGHLNKIKVKVNQKVSAGDVIGLGGRTGRATTTHLHFETRFLGDAFNSNKVIDYDNGKLLSDTLIITRKTFDLLNGKKRFDDDDEVVYVLNKHGKKVKVHRKRKHSRKGAVKSKSKGKSKGKTKGGYEVKQGETLSEIAQKHHTTVKELCKINKITKKKMIRSGQKIKVE